MINPRGRQTRVSNARGWPWGTLMPSPRAAVKFANAPPPGWQREQMPRGCPGRGHGHRWNWLMHKGGNRLKSCCYVTRNVIRLVLFILEIIINVLQKVVLLPLFPRYRYLTLYHLFPAVKKKHIALNFRENKRTVLYTFCFTRKTKVSLFKRRVKSKNVAFASQR